MSLIVMRGVLTIIFLLDKRNEMQQRVKVERTHDEFYARESHKRSTKESFKYIADKLIASYCAGGGGV